MQHFVSFCYVRPLRRTYYGATQRIAYGTISFNGGQYLDVEAATKAIEETLKAEEQLFEGVVTLLSVFTFPDEPVDQPGMSSSSFNYLATYAFEPDGDFQNQGLGHLSIKAKTAIQSTEDMEDVLRVIKGAFAQQTTPFRTMAILALIPQP